ncbi:MAG: 3-hydroxyacyl-CoA dehydrogenase family protein [Longimicrobiales bacterium]
MKVVVIGAGTMGHGIAQVSAMAGYETVQVDATLEQAEAGVARALRNLDDGVKRGKVTVDARDAAAASLRASADIPSAVVDADIVIEAVPERMELKQSVLATADAHMPAGALLGSNTSSLSITDLQNALTHPQRVVGLHFFNPVHINPLIEVVRGRLTDETSMTAALAYVARIGKEAVVVNDSPGFATSRLGVLLGLEAMRMLEEGVAQAADIDRALELGYRHPMGPLKLTDLVGLDVRLDIARYLHEKLGAAHFKPPAILERLVADGHLGKKTGRGFYDWSES